MKKIIIPMTFAAMTLMCHCVLAEEFAYYSNSTVCVYAEPGVESKDKSVSVILYDEELGELGIAHAGEGVVDEDGTYFYKFEFTAPEGKTLENDYKLIARVDGGEAAEFTVTAKPDSVQSYKMSAVDDALLNSAVKIKNLFDNGKAYSFITARKTEDGTIKSVETAEKAFSYGWRGQSSEITVPYVNNGVGLNAYIWDNMKPVSDKLNHTGHYISKFEDGDVVSIAGDSIIHLSTAPAVLEHFYQTREPQKNIRVINTGVGGDVVGGKIGEDNSFGILGRLDWDVYHENPNKIFINSGTNDLLFSLYSPEDSDTATGYKSIRYNSCLENYRNFIDKVKADGKEITVLGEASIYDEADYEGAVEAENAGFNAALVKLNADVMNIAKEKTAEYLNLNKYFNEITDNYRKDNPNAQVLHVSDRIHPTDAGSFIYGALILIHQGVDARVAEAEIDAVSGALKTYNAEVAVTDYNVNSVSYEYTPKAIPMAVNSWYKDAERIIPVTEYLNKEIIKVNNLESGNYTIEYTDANNTVYSLGTYTSDELSEGINIAVNENNPSQIQALSAMVKQEQRFYYDMSYVRKTVQDSEERQQTGTMSEENINALNEMKAISKEYSDEAKELSVPKSYKVTITKVKDN